MAMSIRKFVLSIEIVFNNERNLIMRKIYYSHGNTPERCYHSLTTNPVALTALWDAYVFDLLHRRGLQEGDKDFVPFLGVPTRREDDSVGCMPRHGVFTVGAQTFGRERLSPDVCLIVHLPTAFRGIRSLGATFPPLIFLLGMFVPLIRRRSVLAGDLIERVLVHQVQDLLLEDLRTSSKLLEKLPLLPQKYSMPCAAYPQEQDFLERSLGVLAGDKAFISAVRQSIAATFAKWATVVDPSRYLRRLDAQGVYSGGSPVFYHLQSIPLNPGRVLRMREAPLVRHITAPLTTARGALYRPAVAAGLVGELLRVMDVAEACGDETDSVRRERALHFGVARLTLKGPLKSLKDVYYVVNWDKWFRYRIAAAGEFFLEHLFASLVVDLESGVCVPEDFGAEIKRALLQGYSTSKRSLLLPEGTVKVPAGLLQAWELEDTTGVTVTYRNRILDYGVLAVQKEGRKVENSRGGESIPKLVVRRTTNILPFVFELLLGGTKEKVVSIKAIHRGRKIYFAIPGHFSEFSVRTRSGPYVTRGNRLRDGVTLYQGLYYFTGAFIEKSLDLFPSLVPYQINQIVVFSKNTRKDVLRYIRLTEGPANPGPQTGFTTGEDKAIAALYRPRMTPDAEAELLKVCFGRTPASIVARAKVIRLELISQGVWDINKLPHKRYNHLIGIEILKAKKAAEAAEKGDEK